MSFNSVFNSYPQLLTFRFDSIMKEGQPDQMERAWKVVLDQQNRKDVLDAAAIFYKYFPKNLKKVTLNFSDGAYEFGASQVECFKKESQTLEKILNDGCQIALRMDEFSRAVNSSTASLEVAYYLNIPRLISGGEQAIIKEIERMKHLGDYEAALDFLKQMNHSHLKNSPFFKRLVENELAEVFGNALILYSSRSEKLKSIFESFKEAAITAISLSFETDAVRSVIKQIGEIDSIRTMKVNSFCINDRELSFPKHVSNVELINTSAITVETLKALPVTVVSLKLVGTHFKEQDFIFLPPSLNRLILVDAFPGLMPVSLPQSLTYLELKNCIDFKNNWLNSLPNLSTLIVRNCPGITGKSLLNIPASITHLEMVGSKIEDEDLTKLPENLHTLIIPDSSITDAANLPHVIKLDISGTAITDAGIGKLPDRLTFLAANRCSIKGSTLSRLQTLTHLYLEGCPVEMPYLAQIPRSVTHLSLTSEIRDEDIAYLPNKLNAAVLNGVLMTHQGLLQLPRSLSQIHLLGVKVLAEQAAKYLAQDCLVRI